MNDLTLAQKKKLVPKGKKLDPLKIKYEAEKIYGKGFRKILAQKLECSDVLITLAFTGKAPVALFRINLFIKESIK
jgi:hypothetical protein